MTHRERGEEELKSDSIGTGKEEEEEESEEEEEEREEVTFY